MAALTVGGWFAQSFVDALCNKVASQALDQFGSQSGLRDDLKRLQHTLLKIRTVLTTIDSHRTSDANLLSWLASLRDAAYDADDILDECEFHLFKDQVESSSQAGISFSRIFSSSDGVSAKLRTVLERLEGIAADVGDYLKLVELQKINRFSAEVAVERRETSSFLTETEVLGRETEKEGLISMLLDGGVGDEKFCDVPDSVRHLSFCAYGFKPSEFNGLCKFKKLRTIMFFKGYKPTFDRYLHDMFNQSECIRMIDFSGCHLRQLPESIGNLKLLKHLDLSFTGIERLPTSLCGLYNLQVLSLWHCHIRILPTDLTKLVNLRHLIVEDDKASVLPHIGRLASLHELRKIKVQNRDGHKLDELKEMKELRGKLHVTDLESVGSVDEALNAMMYRKKHLDSLWLEWSSDDIRCVKNEKLDEDVLESLKPHQNLRNLSVSCYSGSTSPSWLNEQHLRDLKEICLIECRKLKQVPLLEQLPFLKVLQIKAMDLVKEISYQNIGGTNNHILFPSLEKLLLSDMPLLEEWLVPNESFSFPNLESLQICDCPRLREFPPLPLSLKNLSIDGAGFTTLPGWQEKMVKKQRFPCLSSLTIRRCSSLKSLREGLMEKHLPVLEALYIWNCEELSFLPGEYIQLLASLTNMVIKDCPNLIIWDHERFMLPSSVKQLTISSCGSLDKQLVRYLKNLTSLESLELSNCSNISSLSAELLCEMRSLVSLCITDCEELACIANPTDLVSLKKLEVKKCPRLIFSPPLNPLNGVSQLHHLCIDNVSFLSESLSSGLLSVHELFICDSPQLRSFAELGTHWSNHLSSLRHLKISNCVQLKFLPEEIAELLNLESLLIENCPEITLLPVKGSFFQPSTGGKYTVHNLIHDLAKSISADEVFIVGDEKFYDVPDSARHLSFCAYGFKPKDKASVLPHIGRLASLHELRKIKVQNRDGHKLDELKEMNELRGKLHVTDLEFVGSIDEALNAMMHRKKHLDTLWLEWSGDDIRCVKNEKLDEEVLESLKPHQNLRNLSVSCYSGSTSPSWLNEQRLCDLKEVCLVECRKLKQVPLLEQLPFLKVLQIKAMDLVKEISYQKIGANNHILFPSLEKLLLCDMPLLEECLVPNENLSFPNLESLQICDCPRLGAFPPLPLSLKNLSIDGAGFTTLPGWQEKMVQQQQFPCLSSLTIQRCLSLKSLREGLMEKHLPFLEALYIWNCEKLSFLPGEKIQLLAALRNMVIKDCQNLIIRDHEPFMLPSSVRQLTISSCGDFDKLLVRNLKNLTSLESLEISNCSNISSLPTELLCEMRSLVSLCITDCEELACIANPTDLLSLKKLEVKKCPKLIFSPPLNPLSGVSQLHHLCIDNVFFLSESLSSVLMSVHELFICDSPQLKSFAELGPHWYDHLSSLRHMKISNCVHLKFLPTEIAEFLNLESLLIENCPEITLLPVKGFPASLKKLEIWRSNSVLREHCRREVGSEWWKISQIPFVIVD
ncbi:putative disease resistance RPP13-like protein 1 [Carex littledalei]|uniref:Putative disease resistance RPP13-like protein 1 n=1 Tax=Carex littledalei TaxID=544730 RepID=A0A833R0C5_9POAL|nr:putative disease resistance RPP13-like protein 1 [Carex littledalei]